MANKQVSDVIRAVRSFHNKLAVVYQNLSERTDRERLKMLLHYMSRHEENLDECLQKYEREGTRRVLDHWLKSKTGEDVLARLAEVQFGVDADSAEIVDTALRIDSLLVGFYKNLANSAESEEVRDLFSALYEMEKKYEGALIRDAVEMEDN